jgi:hypothetical protein
MDFAVLSLNIFVSFAFNFNNFRPRGTLGSVASLLVAPLYEGNLDRNHKLWNIVS